MQKVISKIKPNEIYNLAAQSFVGNSWDLSSLQQMLMLWDL